MIDIATLGKKAHIDADTEPLCTGPDGQRYFLKYGEGPAWYGMNIEGGGSRPNRVIRH